MKRLFGIPILSITAMLIVTVNFSIQSHEHVWGVMPVRSVEEFDKGEIGGEGFQHPHSIARCRTQPDYIYWAQDCNQAWKSRDGGKTWNKVRGEGMLVNRTQSIEVDPVNPNIVFVSTENHSNVNVTWAQEFVGLYRSKDGGKTWKHLLYAPTMLLRSYQHAVAYDPASITDSGATRWYAAFFPDDSLYRSDDGGDSWQAVSSLGEDSCIYCICAHTSDGKTLYLASNRGLFVSTSNGSNLQPLGDLPGGEVSSIALNEQEPGMVYAVVKDKGLYRSVNGGQNFTPVREDDALFVFINPGYPGVIYLVRSTNNLIVSHDAGATWNENVEVNPPEGLARQYRNSIKGDFSGIVPNPDDPSEAVAYCHANFWMTTDTGATFNNSSTLFTGSAWGWYPYGAAFDPEDHGRFFFFCNDFCLLKTANGSDWFERVRPEGLGIWPGSYAGDVLPEPGGKILVANLGYYFQTWIARSVDDGDNWTIVDTNTANNLYVAFHPDSHHIVYAGNKISTDTGATFTVIEYLADLDAEILGICLAQPDIIYALPKPRNTILRSDDRGVTWREYAKVNWNFNKIDSKPTFTTHPENPNKVYTMDNRGDLAEFNGSDWKSLGVLDLAGGADSGNYVKTVAIDPRHPNIIYAGMGLPGTQLFWRSQDSGATWENITGNRPLGGPGGVEVHSLTGDLFNGTGFGTWVFPPPYDSPNSLFSKCEIYDETTPIQKQSYKEKALEGKISLQVFYEQHHSRIIIRLRNNSYKIQPICVKVYTVKGACVRTLFEGRLGSGSKEIIWNRIDDKNHPVSNGIYLIRVEMDKVYKQVKVVLVR